MGLVGFYGGNSSKAAPKQGLVSGLDCNWHLESEFGVHLGVGTTRAEDTRVVTSAYRLEQVATRRPGTGRTLQKGTGTRGNEVLHHAGMWWISAVEGREERWLDNLSV